MTLIKSVKGRLPMNSGAYSSSKVYGKKYRCNLYGCEWESLIEGNTFPPATLDGQRAVVPDTDHWRLVSGVPENYNLEDRISDFNEKLQGKADKGTTLSDYGITDALTATEIDRRISEAKSEIIGGAPQTYDTLKEIAEYIESHKSVEEALNSAIGNKADKATTLAGYGITDAKIANGIITLGSNTITPLTSHQSIYGLTLSEGKFSAKTYTPNSASQTVNIPTKTSHLANDSEFLTKEDLYDIEETYSFYDLNVQSELILGDTDITRISNDSLRAKESFNITSNNGCYVTINGCSFNEDGDFFCNSLKVFELAVGNRNYYSSFGNNTLSFVGNGKNGSAGQILFAYGNTRIEQDYEDEELYLYAGNSGNINIKGLLYCYENVSATAFNTRSDERLKEITGNIELNIDVISNAPAVAFNWKDGSGSSFGSIAQYWQVIVPDAVTAEKKEGYLSMNYASLALVATINVAKEVVNLRSRIEELERNAA